MVVAIGTIGTMGGVGEAMGGSSVWWVCDIRRINALARTPTPIDGYCFCVPESPFVVYFVSAPMIVCMCIVNTIVVKT